MPIDRSDSASSEVEIWYRSAQPWASRGRLVFLGTYGLARVLILAVPSGRFGWLAHRLSPGAAIAAAWVAWLQAEARLGPLAGVCSNGRSTNTSLSRWYCRIIWDFLYFLV